MTGKGQLDSATFRLFEKGGFLQYKIFLDVSFAVVISEVGKTPWVAFTSRFNEWAMVGNQAFLSLIDGERFSAEGNLRDSRTEILGNDVMCCEEMHVQVPMEWLEAVAKSENAKIRVIGSDFTLDDSIKNELKLLLQEVSAI